MEELEKRFFHFPQVEIDLDDLYYEGYILDIGAGEEVVIGQLNGKDVIAVDIMIEELKKPQMVL